MRGKAVIASSLHLEFCGNREPTEMTCERDEFFDKQILTVSGLQFVRLKACLPNCITPSSPEFAKPIVGLYSGLPEKPLSTERHPAIRSGGTLNFIQDVLLIHGLERLLQALWIFQRSVRSEGDGWRPNARGVVTVPLLARRWRATQSGCRGRD